MPPIALLLLALNVPLTVQETAGVARVAEPVTFGVPLPKGLLTDTAKLRLYGPGDKPVAADFRVVNRWWNDAASQVASIQWVHCDFFASVPARERAVYHLRTADDQAPAPPAKLEVTPSGDDVHVSTGALRFTVHRRGPLMDGPGLSGADVLLRSDERIYKLSSWAASELTVEEQTPLKVVLKRTGSHGWVNGKDKALDYVVRITAYAGKSHVRLAYSIVNRQGERMSDFVRLDGLRLEAQLEKNPAPARIEQLSAEPRRPGWFQASGIGFGLRWFWQLY